MNHPGALRMVRYRLRVIVHSRPTAYQFSLRCDHVLAFHPTRDRHRGTIFRLAMEFRSTEQLLSFIRLGTLLQMGKMRKGGGVGK